MSRAEVFFRSGTILVYISRLHSPVGGVHVVTVSRVLRRKRAVTAEPPEDRSSGRPSIRKEINRTRSARVYYDVLYIYTVIETSDLSQVT